MFTDNAIPDKFSWKRYSKMHDYGIYPGFKQTLKTMINNSPWYSVSFDERLNKNQQKFRMEVNLRYWSDEKNIAETSYLDSKFLLRPNAEI